MSLPHTERGAGCGISHLLCLQSRQSAAPTRLCPFALTTTVARLHKSADAELCHPHRRLRRGPLVLRCHTATRGSVFKPRPARAGWLAVLSLLLLLPVSHCDVPQQGLLGELVLIQQQIQRHEEEVQRAAAANNARPPPAEPAPVPPQQKRKVKVATHLDKPVITRPPKKSLALQKVSDIFKLLYFSIPSHISRSLFFQCTKQAVLEAVGMEGIVCVCSLPYLEVHTRHSLTLRHVEK